MVNNHCELASVILMAAGRAAQHPDATIIGDELPGEVTTYEARATSDEDQDSTPIEPPRGEE